MSARGRTRFPFSNDDTASVEDIFEFFEVEITVSCTRGSASWDNCFLDSQLNGKSLEKHIKSASQRMSGQRHTSMFENASLSTKSATPNCRKLVSANAIPTVLVFALPTKPGTVGVVASFTAMMTGGDRMSLFTKRSSSTAWRLPGDAWEEYILIEVRYECSILTSLSNLNFETFFPWPVSGIHISTLSCLLVSASLKKEVATVGLSVTLGRPAVFPPAPRYLSTDLV